MPTGSFPLNIYNDFFTSTTARDLLEVVKLLRPITAILPCTIDALNNKLFLQPQQDENGLRRGEFQAPDNSFFLLNECDLSTGTLLDRGVRNMKVLQEAMEYGTVEYGLEFGTISKQCDFNFCVLGKSSSFLPVSFHLPVVRSEIVSTEIDVSTGALVERLIALMQEKQFEVVSEMEESIHEGFIQSQAEARKVDGKPDDGSALLNRLIVAEHVCKSFGKFKLDVESWVHAGELEKTRLSRLKK